MKSTIFMGGLLAASMIVPTPAMADQYLSRPDGHAPIGVMRDHVHQKGEVMLSYRYGFMRMEGLRRGTDKVSAASLFPGFMMAPHEMDMRMHMWGIMAGVTDRLTLAAMAGFIDSEMTMQTMMGSTSQTESDGFSDVKLNGLYQLYATEDRHLLLNFGISLPTGSIDEGDGMGMRFGYPMQIGSGTVDLLPGISYSQFFDHWSFGGQVNATLRTGNNDNGYTLGDRYLATAWASRRLNDAWSVSLRLEAQNWDEVDGVDAVLNPMMSPANRGDFQGGSRVDGLVGVNYTVPSGGLKGNRFAVEAGHALYEDVNGTQLANDWRITFGWQYAFNAF